MGRTISRNADASWHHTMCLHELLQSATSRCSQGCSDAVPDSGHQQRPTADTSTAVGCHNPFDDVRCTAICTAIDIGQLLAQLLMLSSGCCNPVAPTGLNQPGERQFMHQSTHTEVNMSMVAVIRTLSLSQSFVELCQVKQALAQARQ